MQSLLKFTTGHVFVFHAPYLKLMKGESSECEGYIPTKDVENHIQGIGEKSKSYPEWVHTWFDDEAKRHYTCLVWDLNDADARSRFAAALSELPESERCGIVRDEECERLDVQCADKMNERLQEEEIKRTEARAAWFADPSNTADAELVSVLKGTRIANATTGQWQLDPVEKQFIDNLLKFASEGDRPERTAVLGCDSNGKICIGYSFRLPTLRREFERRVNTSKKKPEGIEVLHDGSIYEELVMQLVDKNRKASDK